MGFCNKCKFYQLETVLDPYSGEEVTVKMCQASSSDACPAEAALGPEAPTAVPCPICGREMREADEMCDICLKYEMNAQNDAANERQHIRDILEAS